VSFKKKIENFHCLNCGTDVVGNGYTDHCPSCLWGRHVDTSPGDRAANCGGMMEPTGALKKKGEWRILYRCQKCGYEHWNRISKDDNFEKIVKMTSSPADGGGIL